MALFGAVQFDHLKILNLLMSKYPSHLNQKNDEGATLLMMAVNFGHLRVVSALIQEGADLDAIFTPEDLPGQIFTALTMAEASNQTAIAQVIREALNKQVLKANSPPVLKVFEQFFQNTLNGNEKNEPPETYLREAATKGQLSRVQEVIQKHPSMINKTDEIGMTPLMLAAREGHLDIVQVLIKAGANLDAVMSVRPGFNALRLAELRKHQKISDAIREASNKPAPLIFHVAPSDPKNPNTHKGVEEKPASSPEKSTKPDMG